MRVIVEQIWTGNAYRNFNYLIACGETGDTLAIDPLDHVKCLAVAKSRGWHITQVLNTHEHHDHIGGNGAMVAATGAKILARHRRRRGAAHRHHRRVGVRTAEIPARAAGRGAAVGEPRVRL